MLSLRPHPSTPTDVVKSIDVAVGRTGSGYRFWYFVIGDIAKLVVPPRIAGAGRRDELWRTTCFEAFVKGDNEAYCEFNFAPSGEWASYAFERYREGAHPTAASVRIDTAVHDNLLCLEARMNADFALSTRLCLAAVIEQRDGSQSHWALAHPDTAKADFHHDACFAVRLADIA